MKRNAKQIAMALVPHVRAYLVTKVNAQVWREKMDTWAREELKKFEYKTAARYLEGRGGAGLPARITDPQHTYLMDEADYQLYREEWQYFVDSLNLGLEPDICPALMAEELERKAGNRLLEYGCQLINQPGFNLERLNIRLEWRQEAIDLMCGMACKTGKIK